MTTDSTRDSFFPFLCFLIVVACQIHTSAPERLKDSKYKRVCYYTNWSQYRRDQGRFLPSDIDPFLCTHLIFAFAKIDNGVLAPYEWNDLEHPFLYKQFTDLKKRNPKLKTMLAVGGWNHGSMPFTAMVGSKAGRSKFIEHAIQYLRTNNFDGIDVDWEYPASRGSPVKDKANFASLAQELREAFAIEAKKTRQERLLLTMAVPGGEKLTLAGYDVKKLNKYVDFFNLMSYDLHGGWSPTIGHHAPLRGGNKWAPANSKPENVEKSVNLWLKLGADPEKLVMGLAFYGKTFKLCTKGHKTGDPSCGAGRPDTLPYYDILRKLKTRRLRRRWMDGEQVPFAVSDFDRLWVGYDDQESLVEKVNYAKKKHLGGVMVWSLDQDDFTGRFGGLGVRYPLMNTVKDALEGKMPNKPLLPSYIDTEEPRKFMSKNSVPEHKSRRHTTKEHKLNPISSKAERFPSMHPSAVPMFASLMGPSSVSRGAQAKQRQSSSPYRSAGSDHSQQQRPGGRKERRRGGRGRRVQTRKKYQTKQPHTSGNDVRTKSRDSERESGKNIPVNKRRQNHPAPTSATPDHRHARPTRPGPREDESRDRPGAKQRGAQSRLVRGRQRKRSGKASNVKSPHNKKTPVLYHPRQIGARRPESAFADRVPYSAISFEKDVPKDYHEHGDVFKARTEEENTQYVDTNDDDVSRLPTKRHREDPRNMRPRYPQTRRPQDNTPIKDGRESRAAIHPYAKTFSASLNRNHSDAVSGHNTDATTEESDTESFYTSTGRPDQDNRRRDNSRDQGLPDKSDSVESFRDFLEDPLAEGDLYDSESEESEYVIIQHDPNKKWYEPIMFKQPQEELDLKLADAVPYDVPWRSQDNLVEDKGGNIEETKSVKKRKAGPEPRRLRAAQRFPFSGDKFVRVHAVPLSGLSLTDIVSDQSSEDSAEQAESSEGQATELDGDKQRHIPRYHSNRPWFSKQVADAGNTTEDRQSYPSTERPAPQTLRGSQDIPETGNLRRRKSNQRRFKPRKAKTSVVSDPQDEESDEVHVNEDEIESNEKTPVTSESFQEKSMNSPFSPHDMGNSPNSVHNKDVWWEFPKIEKYQAIDSAVKTTLPPKNSDQGLEIERLTQTDKHVTTEGSSFYASDPKLESGNKQQSHSDRQILRKNLETRSEAHDVNRNAGIDNRSKECDTDGNCLDRSTRQESETENHRKVKSGTNRARERQTSSTVEPHTTISHQRNTVNGSAPDAKTTTPYSNKEAGKKGAKSISKRRCAKSTAETNSTLTDDSQLDDCDDALDSAKSSTNQGKQRVTDDLLTESHQNRTVLKRRKAGRRNPQPHAYHNLDSNRSPFKPPIESDLYYNSPVPRPRTRISQKASGLRPDDDNAHHSRRPTHRHSPRKLQKLRQLLQNSSVVEKLKSKLDEIHQQIRVTPTPFLEVEPTYRTTAASDESVPPRERRIQGMARRDKQRPWYETKERTHQVKSTSSQQDHPSSPYKAPVGSRYAASKDSFVNRHPVNRQRSTIYRSSQRGTKQSGASATTEETASSKQVTPATTTGDYTHSTDDDVAQSYHGPETIRRRGRQYHGEAERVRQYPREAERTRETERVRQYPGGAERARQYPGEVERVRQYPSEADRVRQYPGEVERAWWDHDRDDDFEKDNLVDVNEDHSSRKIEKMYRGKPQTYKNDLGIADQVELEMEVHSRPTRRSLLDAQSETTQHLKTSGQEEKVMRRRRKPLRRRLPRHELYRARVHLNKEKLSPSLSSNNTTEADMEETATEVLESQPHTTESSTDHEEAQNSTSVKRQRIRTVRRSRSKAQAPTQETNQKGTGIPDSLKIAETNVSATESVLGPHSHSNTTEAPTSSTVAWVTAVNKLPEKMVGRLPEYPEQQLYQANFEIMKRENIEAIEDKFEILKEDNFEIMKGDYTQREKIKDLVEADGKGGWSFMRNRVTPAPIPGAKLVSSGFSTGGFSCPSTFGIYKDSENCHMFYQCVWFVAFHHICGQGTAWNENDRICDWPTRTRC